METDRARLIRTAVIRNHKRDEWRIEPLFKGAEPITQNGQRVSKMVCQQEESQPRPARKQKRRKQAGKTKQNKMNHTSHPVGVRTIGPTGPANEVSLIYFSGSWTLSLVIAC